VQNYFFGFVPKWDTTLRVRSRSSVDVGLDDAN
jgi:hypothetical protein